MAENNSKIHCVVVTPEKALVDQESDSLVIPLFDGEMGILPNRAPLVSKLGFGSLRIRNGSTDSFFFIEGGTVQISNNIVTLLTPRATELAAWMLMLPKLLLIQVLMVKLQVSGPSLKIEPVQLFVQVPN